MTYTVVGQPGVDAQGRLGDRGPRRHRAVHGHAHQPPNETTTVNYTTGDGTATSTAPTTSTTPGTLTFNPGGSQLQTVNVPVVNNSVYRHHARVHPSHHESAPTRSCAHRSTTGRIRDDEIPAVRVAGRHGQRGPTPSCRSRVSLAGPPNAPRSRSTTRRPTSDRQPRHRRQRLHRRERDAHVHSRAAPEPDGERRRPRRHGLRVRRRVVHLHGDQRRNRPERHRPRHDRRQRGSPADDLHRRRRPRRRRRQHARWPAPRDPRPAVLFAPVTGPLLDRGGHRHGGPSTTRRRPTSNS